MSPFAHRVPRVDQRLLVDAGALVRPAELREPVGDLALAGAAVVLDDDGIARDVGDVTVALGEDQVARVAGGAGLDAGADERRGRTQHRDGLALHVGAHEGAVGVVVLEEGDERRRDRDDLLRRDVHVVDLGGLDVGDFAASRPHEHLVVEEAAGVVDPGVRLGDDVAVLVVGGEVLDLLGCASVVDLAVRRLDEPEPVDARVRREVADEADVRAFRRLDRAHAAVVAGVHVADLEARPAHARDRRARAPRGGACG